LRRTVDRQAASALLRTHSGPLVLVVTTDNGEPQPSVLIAHDDTRWDVHRISPDGETTESRDTIDSIIAGIGTQQAELFIAARLVEPTHEPHASAGARLLELIVAEKGQIGLVYLYATLVGLFSLTLPLGVQAIIGLVSGGLILQPVVLLVVFVVLGTLAYGILQVMQLSVVETIQQRIFARFALEFVVRLPRLAMERCAGEDLSSRSSSDWRC
jgi:ABC-type bacteriocin/lantibiotic exporter with double-glycine peptidase domain